MMEKESHIIYLLTTVHQSAFRIQDAMQVPVPGTGVVRKETYLPGLRRVTVIARSTGYYSTLSGE
jgi:hypothetical protein